MIPDVRIRWNSEPLCRRLIVTPSNPPLSLVFMGSQKYPYKGIIDAFSRTAKSEGVLAVGFLVLVRALISNGSAV